MSEVDAPKRDLSDERARRLQRIAEGVQYPDRMREEARRMLKEAGRWGDE